MAGGQKALGGHELNAPCHMIRMRGERIRDVKVALPGSVPVTLANILSNLATTSSCPVNVGQQTQTNITLFLLLLLYTHNISFLLLLLYTRPVVGQLVHIHNCVHGFFHFWTPYVYARIFTYKCTHLHTHIHTHIFTNTYTHDSIHMCSRHSHTHVQ